MTTGFLVQTTIEIILVIAVIIMLLNEDKMIEFEDRIKEKITNKIKRRK